MLEFKTFDLCNLDILSPYYRGRGPSMDNFVGVEYMWADVFNTRFAVWNDTLIVRSSFNNTCCFRFPIGKDVEGALCAIDRYMAGGGSLHFMLDNAADADILRAHYKAVTLTDERDWYEYLYTAADLASMQGKKYHGQRNHINKFKSTYPDFVFEVPVEADLPLLHAFLAENEAAAPRTEEEKREFCCCHKLLDAVWALELPCAVIKVGAKIIALCIGEIHDDCLVIHVEKANADYAGVYPTMVSLFAQRFAKNVRYINREDDAGDEGLRTSKMQYHPCRMIEKHKAVCHTSLDIKFDSLVTPRLTVGDFCREDMADYAALAGDAERNRFWEVGYAEYLSTADLSEETLWQGIKGDEAAKTCYCRKISDKSGAFVGEAVVYDFRFDGTAEVGLRITADKAGKGYGREAYAAITDYLKGKGIKLRARCFAENAQSKKMILAAGFKWLFAEGDMLHFAK